jgi:hypothetical protein
MHMNRLLVAGGVAAGVLITVSLFSLVVGIVLVLAGIGLLVLTFGALRPVMSRRQVT